MKNKLNYKDYLKNTKDLSTELKSTKTKYDSLSKALKNEKKTLQESSKLILRKYDSISIESTLQKYPPNAQGSVFFYNLIMGKTEAYENNHLENITRFFTYTEHLEREYETFYKTATVEYFRDPYHPSIKSLYRTHQQLVETYKLMFILISEVDRDKIHYLKVYNQLEDNGIFLSQPEKTALKYMSQISSKLTQVISGLDNVFKSITESNKLLKISLNSLNTLNDNIDSISSDMYSIGYNIEDMQSEIWGLSSKK